jgi:hypothetical protein
MKLIVVFIFIGVVSGSLFSQSKYTVSGYVSDVKTGEAIIGAQVGIPSMKSGTTSNTYGFYSLTLPGGKYNIEFKFSGQELFSTEIDLNADLVLNHEFVPLVEELDEVVIRSKQGSNLKDAKIGQIDLGIDVIKLLPAFMGEVDVLKSIQLLPGVSSVSEGGQGFYVRGGGPDQNLVLLDDALVYNASHLFGFFSVFNADAIKNVNLIKGGMPANYGGRMSSVLEVNMNEGNNKEFRVKGGIGLISSRLTVEGPLRKDKGSFILSGRRTYIDILTKPFIPKESPFSGTGYFFYDVNLKANYRISPKDKVYLSGYYGKDQFNFGNKKDDFQVNMPWGNGIMAVRWNHLFTNKLFLNVSATLTDYQFSFGSQQDEFKVSLSSMVRDIGGKVDFSYYASNRHKIKFGIDYIHHAFTPTSVAASQADVAFDTGLSQKMFSHEPAVYLLDEFELNARTKMNVGLRYSSYQQVGPFTRYVKGNISVPDSIIVYQKGDLIKFYGGFEPRFTTRFLLDERSSVKVGYSYNYQYVHLTSLSAVSLPTDIWFPSTGIAKPQSGWQLTAGYFRNFFNDKLESSIELYYKGMNNLIEYKEGALPQENVKDNTDNLLTFGRGWSYGAEFFVKRSFGKLTGWIGYTWSKTERKFDDLNSGKVFPAKYDRRHDLTITTTYKFSKHWVFSGVFIYATGNTLTLPTAWYVQDQDLLLDYGARNSTRMAPYHRLDLSATRYGKSHKMKMDEGGEMMQIKKKCQSNWSFSLYNVYNRANPFFLYVDNEGGFLTGDFKVAIKQVSLFPLIPSVTWNFEF